MVFVHFKITLKAAQGQRLRDVIFTFAKVYLTDTFDCKQYGRNIERIVDGEKTTDGKIKKTDTKSARSRESRKSPKLRTDQL